MHQDERNKHLNFAELNQQSDLDAYFQHVTIRVSPTSLLPGELFMLQRLSNVIWSWVGCALIVAAVLTMTHLCVYRVSAQTDDAFSDAAADPVKLFERGQTAHARGDLLKALELYDEAIKVRPEFAEAEFQK